MLDVDFLRGLKLPLNPELDTLLYIHVLFLLIHTQGHGGLESFGSVRPMSLYTLLTRQVSILHCRACLDILQINLAAVKTIMRIQSLSIIKIVAAWLQTLRLWRVFNMSLLISRNVASLSVVNVVLIVQTAYIYCISQPHVISLLLWLRVAWKM